VKAFDPDPTLRWLFCMTHPDDEISICVWIHRLARAGNEVFISWTHASPERMFEGKRAARVLGVPQERLIFHHGTDGAICEEMPYLLSDFRSMMEQVKPDRVVCGAFEQGHLDHDATNLLVFKSFPGVTLEIPFYHTYLNRRPTVNRFAQSAGQEVVTLDRHEQHYKVRFARQYPSQAIWRNLLLAEARRVITRPRAEKLKETERMRVQTHRDFLTPNLPEKLASRVSRCPKWLRWRAAAQAIL
jgi:LmbE family N-acetylglucosaminyl deacetylase